jgi:RNA polymerase sigma-70 factor (ECF subfamily)
MTAKASSAPRWRRRHREAPRRPIHHTQIPEEVVIDAASGGDLRAWEDITRRHQEVVFRSAYLATRDSASAEEATKVAFMRAYRSLRSLESGAALRPWLIGIATTVARAHIREMAQRRDAKVSDPDPCPRVPATPIYVDPGAPRLTSPEHDAIVNAFDGLVDEDRLIIASRYSFHLSRTDAAARVGIGPDQIDGRLGAAIGRLRIRSAEMMAMTMSPDSDGRSIARSGLRVDHFGSLGDDQLGSMTMAAVMSELPWTPDVAPVVCSRLAREAVAYPEQFGAHATAARAGTGPDTATPQTSAPLAITAHGSRGPATRGSAVLPMMAAALVVAVVLVGMSVAVGGQSRDVPAEVGARISALLGQAESRPVTEEGVETSTAGLPPAADDPLVANEVPDLAVAERRMVQAPQLSIIGARTLGNGEVGARVSVDWSPADGFGPVAKERLERKVGNGTWASGVWADAGGQLKAAIGPDKRYRFRVRSVDEAGTAVVSPVVRAELAVRDPRSKRLALAPDDWIVRHGNVIKRRLIATTPGASLSTEFSGSSVALVAPTGPSRGAIGVRVDGGPWVQDDLGAWVPSPRTVVFSQDLDQEHHSLDIRAEAVGVAVDAILIVHTRQA